MISLFWRSGEDSGRVFRAGSPAVHYPAGPAAGQAPAGGRCGTVGSCRGAYWA